MRWLISWAPLISRGELAHPLLGEAVARPRGADRGDDHAVPVSDRGGHGVQPELVLLQGHCVPAVQRFYEVLLQLRPRRQGARRVLLQAGFRQQLHAPLRREVGEEDLAAGGGVQRSQLADPVVRRDRGRAAHLAEVDRVLLLQDGDVDRLAEFLGQPLAHGAAHLGDVDPSRDGARQPYDPEAEPVLAALRGLFDESARLQRPEEPERRRLVDVDLSRHLADARLAAPGEDLQHADGAVDGLHPARRGARCFGGCLVVAHGETILVVTNGRSERVEDERLR